MVSVNWTSLAILVIGLFALAGFFKGWWKEAITTSLLAILVLFLQVPGIAQFFIDIINWILDFVWRILPTFVTDFLETTLGIGVAGLPPQIDAASPQTWIIILIVFIGLAVLIGRLGLPGSARNSNAYNGYVVTWGGRLFGAILGAVNAWLIISLFRAYLDGSKLPGSSSAMGMTTASSPANDVVIQAVDVPVASIMDSFLPWLLGGIGVAVLIAALKSRYGVQEEKGFRKMAYKSPPGYKRAKVSGGSASRTDG